ncbi:Nck-associated protein 1 [Nowakowskiella sp. JEL0407]|nr:Nck-associated protein 1 [Nowakowskiella sp. JEL0407]
MVKNTEVFVKDVVLVISQLTALVLHDVALLFVQNEVSCRTLETEKTVDLTPTNKKPTQPKRDNLTNLKTSVTSEFKSVDTKLLQKLKQILRNLIYTLKTPPISLSNTIFHPLEYFYAFYTSRVHSYLSGVVYTRNSPDTIPTVLSVSLGISSPSGGGGGVQSLGGNGGSGGVNGSDEDVYGVPMDAVKRPSILKSELNAYRSALGTIGSLMKIDCMRIFREVYLENLNDELIRKNEMVPEYPIFKYFKDPKNPTNKSKYSNLSTSPFPKQSFLITYAMWYVDFAGSKLISGGGFYSPARLSFVSNKRPGNSGGGVQPELYTDQNEMTALCELLGCNGILYICERLLRVVVDLVGYIKETIISNQVMLDSFGTIWMDDMKYPDMHQVFKEIPPKIITLSVVLKVYQMLLSTLGTVISNSCPQLAKCIQTTREYTKYIPGDHEQPIFKTIESMASSIGTPGKIDTMIFNALRTPQVSGQSVATDTQIWKYLPRLFAVCVYLMAAEERSKYILHFDGMENNSHLVEGAFRELTLHLHEIGRRGRAHGKEGEEQSLRQEFLSMSSSLLLNTPWGYGVASEAVWLATVRRERVQGQASHLSLEDE